MSPHRSQMSAEQPHMAGESDSPTTQILRTMQDAFLRDSSDPERCDIDDASAGNALGLGTHDRDQEHDLTSTSESQPPLDSIPQDVNDDGHIDLGLDFSEQALACPRSKHLGSDPDAAIVDFQAVDEQSSVDSLFQRQQTTESVVLQKAARLSQGHLHTPAPVALINGWVEQVEDVNKDNQFSKPAPPSRSARMQPSQDKFVGSQGSTLSTTQENDPDVYKIYRANAQITFGTRSSQHEVATDHHTITSTRGTTDHTINENDNDFIGIDFASPQLPSIGHRWPANEYESQLPGEGHDDSQDPKTPAPPRPHLGHSHGGSILRQSQLFSLTQASPAVDTTPLTVAPSSTRPSPDLFNHSRAVDRIVSSPLKKHAEPYPPDDNQVDFVSSSAPASQVDETTDVVVDDVPRRILRSGRQEDHPTLPPRRSTEPRDIYVSVQSSQERKHRHFAVLSLHPGESDDDLQDPEFERTIRVQAMKKKGFKSITNARPVRLSSTDSDIVEVPSTARNRQRSEADQYVAQYRGDDARDSSQNRIIVDSQSKSQRLEPMSQPAEAELGTFRKSGAKEVMTSSPRFTEAGEQAIQLQFSSTHAADLPESEASTQRLYSQRSEAHVGRDVEDSTTLRGIKTPIDIEEDVVPETSPVSVHVSGETRTFANMDVEYPEMDLPRPSTFQMTQPDSVDLMLQGSSACSPPAFSQAPASSAPQKPAFPSRTPNETPSRSPRLKPALVSTTETIVVDRLSSPSTESSALTSLISTPSEPATCSPPAYSDSDREGGMDEHRGDGETDDTFFGDNDDSDEAEVGDLPDVAAEGQNIYNNGKKCQSSAVARKTGSLRRPSTRIRMMNRMPQASNAEPSVFSLPETLDITVQPAANDSLDPLRAKSTLKPSRPIRQRTYGKGRKAITTTSKDSGTTQNAIIVDVSPTPNSTGRGTRKATPRALRALAKNDTSSTGSPSGTPITKAPTRSSKRVAEGEKARSEDLAVPITPSRSKRAVGLNSDNAGLFYNMAFCVSYLGRPEEKETVTDLLRSGGGLLLQNGFDELFEPASTAFNTPSSAKGRAADVLAVVDKLTLRPTFSGLGFTCLIADDHSRRTKFMQALALGLPCISGMWVLHCVAKDRVIPWEPYMLAAGKSDFLGGAVKSRNLTSYPAQDSSIAETFEARPKILLGKRILIVMSKGKTEVTRKPYYFLTQALGAKCVKRVVTNEEARRVLLDAEGTDEAWDWVYVDDEKSAQRMQDAEKVLFGVKPRKRKRTLGADETNESEAPPKRIRLISDEYIIQSLIWGGLMDET